ncbi:MAG: SPOR domain-containing protein [Bacteroidetes bacterium]|nr:SPOR domain-containing protein [Bacteroidota bacterium]
MTPGGKKLVFALSFIVFNVGAQSIDGPDIRRRLEMIERGQAEVVRAELPSLLAQYQNNPGILYLQAVLTPDGAEAAKIYQTIVDNFPRSEWADDALYRLYQYYYSIGLYKTADQKLQQLKQEYPFSAYATDQPSIADNHLVLSREKNQSLDKQSSNVVRRERDSSQELKISPSRYPAGFTVQVGAFSTLQNAEELKSRFEQEGYSCYIFSLLTNGRKLHKVWIGEYKTYTEAREVVREIKEKYGLNAIVVSR